MIWCLHRAKQLTQAPRSHSSLSFQPKLLFTSVLVECVFLLIVLLRLLWIYVFLDLIFIVLSWKWQHINIIAAEKLDTKHKISCASEVPQGQRWAQHKLRNKRSAVSADTRIISLWKVEERSALPLSSLLALRLPFLPNAHWTSPTQVMLQQKILKVEKEKE